MIWSFSSSTWRYILCIAIVDYVSGASMAPVPLMGIQILQLNTFLTISIIVSAVILILLWETFHFPFSFQSAYGIILFTVATSFLLLPMIVKGYLAILAGFCAFAFSIVSIFMAITSLEIARIKNIDPTAVFGIFAGCVYLPVAEERIELMAYFTTHATR